MRKEDRDEGSPLIIAGGAAVSINPEVISDFTDAFFIGEGEDSIKEFICLFSLNQNPGRDEILTRASEIDGVYVPEFYSIDYGKEGYMDNVHCPSSCDFPVKRRINPELTYLSHSVIISPDTEFADMHLIEIARGCPFSCGFCCVSLHNRPFRPASVDGLYAKIDEAMTETGRIGLMGAAVGSHPRFPDILRYIQSKGGNVGFSSLRADVLSSEVIRCLGELGQRVITLAPETGTDDLRKKLNKTLTNRSLLKTVDISLESGFREIRLYFMLGVPGETEDDIKAIGELIREVEGRAQTVGGRVFVSVNQLIPKPGTGLEMYPMAGEEEVLGRFKSVQSCFYNNPAVEFKMESPKSALVQAFLSRGSRKWGEYLLKFYSGSTSGISHMIMKHQKKDPSINKLLFSHIPTGVLPPWKIIQ